MKQTLKIGLILTSLAFGLAFGMVFSRAVFAAAAEKVVLSGGTIYLVTDTEKRAFPSAEVYFSHGYEFTDAVASSSADIDLADGQAMSYRDGSLVKGDSAAVYIISSQTKRPFVSGEVFLGLGYSFANVLSDSAGLLGSLVNGLPVDSASTGHPAGTLVNNAGTIFLITPTGRQGIPTLADFNSRRYDFADVVLASAQDLALSDVGLIGEAQEADVPVEEPAVEEPVVTEPEAEPAPVVAPSAPTKEGVIAAFPRKFMTFSFTSTDPDGDDISYTVDWGDGTAKTTETKTSGVKFTTRHEWMFIGDYTITVTADDGKGNATISEFPMKVGLDPSEFGPVVTVISPNGGEVITIGSVYTIEWKWNWIPLNTDEEVTIFFRQDSSANREIVINEDDQTYSWVVTGDGIVVADNYKIVVLSEGTPGTGISFDDSSDSTFSLK